MPRATEWDAGTQLSLSGTAGIVAALRPGVTVGADGPESAELRCARPCDQCGAASPRSAVCRSDGTEPSAPEPSTARPARVSRRRLLLASPAGPNTRPPLLPLVTAGTQRASGTDCCVAAPLPRAPAPAAQSARPPEGLTSHTGCRMIWNL